MRKRHVGTKPDLVHMQLAAPSRARFNAPDLVSPMDWRYQNLVISSETAEV
jgi:hypothetical protein